VKLGFIEVVSERRTSGRKATPLFSTDWLVKVI